MTAKAWRARRFLQRRAIGGRSSSGWCGSSTIQVLSPRRLSHVRRTLRRKYLNSKILPSWGTPAVAVSCPQLPDQRLPGDPTGADKDRGSLTSATNTKLMIISRYQEPSLARLTGDHDLS
jgi:hypothetical protein